MNTHKLLAILAVTAIVFCSFSAIINPVKAQGLDYEFIGPLMDGTDDWAYGDVATLTLTSIDGTIYTHDLAPDVGWHFTSAQLATVSWNASAVDNATRIIDFLPTETSGTFNIHIANPDLPTSYYLFTFTDYFGMTNPYVGIYTSEPSDLTLQERHNLVTSNTVPFYLRQFYTYYIDVICDQGSYSIPFRTGAVFSQSISILAGSFGSNNYASSNASATRSSGTTIDFTYYNPNSTTTKDYVSVFHYSGTTEVQDYSATKTSSANSYSGTITVGDESLNYYTKIVATEIGVNKTWIIPCPALTTGQNPFVIIDKLGSIPGVDLTQLIPLALISLFLAVGSFKSTGASCIFAAIAAGFFVVMGWYVLSTWFIGFAIFLGVLTYIAERKEEQGR